MGEGGVAKRGGERRGECYQKERSYDLACGEDGSGPCAGFGVVAKVGVAYQGSEKGLDCVEEDGEFEELRGGGGTVGSSCQAFLKEGPCETIPKLAYQIGTGDAGCLQ